MATISGELYFSFHRGHYFLRSGVFVQAVFFFCRWCFCLVVSFSVDDVFVQAVFSSGTLFSSAGCFCPSGSVFFSVDDVFVRAVFLSGHYFLRRGVFVQAVFSSGTLFSSVGCFCRGGVSFVPPAMF